MSAGSHQISFPNGSRATVVEVPGDMPGDEMLARLELPRPAGTIVVNGSTADLTPAHRARADDALVNGVARVATAKGLTVVTGATAAGIFSILGPALVASSAPLVGVAPSALVTWPGRDRRDADQAALEAHHSHFLLVEGQEWGDETAALLALAAALGALAPSVAVLCGGGGVARTEALGHCRAGRPLVVIGGSGRLADELAAGGGDDPGAAEILASGRVTVCPPEQDGRAIGDAVLAALDTRS